jgi:hypothetical protein
MPVSPRGARRASARARLRLALASAASIGLSLSLAACGLSAPADKADGPSASVVAIETTALPSAGVSAPYSTSLSASGGVAPYSWSVASGSAMPPGLSLSSSGGISGSATQVGTHLFTVVVADAGAPAATDTATYAITVAQFNATISGLHYGEAWTGESYPVTSVGSPSTTYSLVANQSGASLQNPNPAGGTVSYRAGVTTGTDRIRATSASGETEDIDVVVVANPVAGMTARFSSTDVWHVRFDGKFDTSHVYDSDFHWGLATVGMRATSSTSAIGTAADELASVYVRKQVLRYLNQSFLNNGDGTAAANGLAISFPFTEPSAPHFCPANGAVANPVANQFNVVSMIGGGSGGVIGTGYLDDSENSLQENDTTSAQAGQLGVFVDEITPIFNAAYSNKTLAAVPVGAADVPALKALLYGLAKPLGSRYDELQRIGEGYGRTLAAVAAHEIGHSLGLSHTSPSQPSSIMNSGAVISPSATYLFVAGDVTALRGALPGPGRGGSNQTVEGWVSPDAGDVGGGIPCPCCRLRIQPPKSSK